MKSSTLAGIFLAVFLVTPSLSIAAPEDHFVTTWNTENTSYRSSDSTSILVPMVGGPYDVDWNNDDFETFPMKSINCSDGNEESSSQFLSQPPNHCCTKCLLSLNKSKFSKTQWKRRGKGAQCMVCIERRRR